MTASTSDASPKSIAGSLIEKLESLKFKPAVYPGDIAAANINGHSHAIDQCIAIIRQHQSEQSEDQVERVAEVIHVAWHEKGSTLEDVAAAAIAAMGSVSSQELKVSGMTSRNDPANLGDGSATIAPVSAESVQSITPAIRIATFNELNAASNITDERAITDDELDRAVNFLASMGDDSTRKDEGPMHTGLPASPSDIQDNRARNDLYLIEKMCMAAWGTDSKLKKEVQASIMEDALDAIRPYLRTTEPVSVSLTECTNVLEDMANKSNSYNQLNERCMAKAVLEAAGVKYVD